VEAGDGPDLLVVHGEYEQPGRGGGRLDAIAEVTGQGGLGVGTGAKTAISGVELASAFSTALNRNIRYMALPLDAFEEGVDAAVGPGVGQQVGAIFRFIERHPDDRGFVSRPFWVPAGFPPFEPASVTGWVAAHAHAFSPADDGGPETGASAARHPSRA